MILNAATPLHVIDGPILLRLGAAALLGLLLGLDRELRGHAAGLRTHGILCFTCALMTISAIALHNQLTVEGNIDPLRIFEASAAFTGIIAAGLIVFNKGEVKNLTTAAHIWLAAMIGIACGAVGQRGDGGRGGEGEFGGEDAAWRVDLAELLVPAGNR